MIEKRLTYRLIKYWNQMRGSSTLPEIERLDIYVTDVERLGTLSESISDLWNKCLLISITEKNPLAVKYQYIGTELLSLFGRDFVGKVENFSDLSYTPITKLLGKTRTPSFIQEPRPLIDEGKFEFIDKKIIKYRSCILPFGTGANDLTHLIIGMTWRSV